ncbi:unnamed protein product [Notodromas monacha]|uniref:Enkurin domain-containing protein n=1 Tax=Notodromas monacha TaxID=399045 RepID=A0A7R9BKS0_9CRUS|nr:unnamed protein product [Notodromas monacha]CAG0917038.1 unnamed protein product [Notodromas monacha]
MVTRELGDTESGRGFLYLRKYGIREIGPTRNVSNDKGPGWGRSCNWVCNRTPLDVVHSPASGMSVAVLPELRLRENHLKAARRRGIRHVTDSYPGGKPVPNWNPAARSKSEQKLPGTENAHEHHSDEQSISISADERRDRIRSIIFAVELQKPLVMFSGYKTEKRPGSASSMGSRSVSYHSLCLQESIPGKSRSSPLLPAVTPKNKVVELRTKPAAVAKVPDAKFQRKALPVVKSLSSQRTKASEFPICDAPSEKVEREDNSVGVPAPCKPKKLPEPKVVVRKIPEKPPPRHPIPIPADHIPGVVPKYLKKRQAKWEKEENAEKERQEKLRLAPPGFSVMSEDEKIETLEGLKKKEEALVRELVSLPVRIDTMRIQRRKLEIENQLSKIDEGNPMEERFPIKSLFFSEFDYSLGPCLTYQVPEEGGEHISKELFEAISVYIIPKPDVQGTVVTVNAMGYKIVGYPVAIRDKKYFRNFLMFNLCFVCRSKARTVQFEPVVKKLAEYLMTLEAEQKFLITKEKKALLPKFMTMIYNGLNSYTGTCSIAVDNANTFHLKVVPVRRDPAPVEDWDVPIFSDRYALARPKKLKLEKWDLTTGQILPFIDGFNHVRKIAALADVDVSLVKNGIQHLVYDGVAKLVSVFQYSNMYAATPELHKLYTDTELQQECLQTVANLPPRLPPLRDVFKLYGVLKPGMTVKDLCVRHNPQMLGIDERRFIQFGFLHGLIRRVHKFPVLLKGQRKRSTGPVPVWYRLCDGTLSVDAICCKTGLPSGEILSRIEKDPNLVVVCK